jgi:hypothetical protein
MANFLVSLMLASKERPENLSVLTLFTNKNFKNFATTNALAYFVPIKEFKTENVFGVSTLCWNFK